MRRLGTLIFALLVFYLCSGCSDNTFGPSGPVELRMIVTSWGWGGSESETYFLEVYTGERFGSPGSTGSSHQLFKLVAVLADDLVVVEHVNDLAASDEEKVHPFWANCVYVSAEETCINTKTICSGVSYCLKIVD